MGPRPPIELSLSADALAELAQQLAQEIEDAIAARTRVVGSDGVIRRWHHLYEQRPVGPPPWPGAATLTSYLGTEKVDALRARLLQIIYTEPLWVVEGWGASAANVPLVEAFHQWKVEEEGLQQYLSQVIHNALIEGTGVLEVSERAEVRRLTREARVAVATAPDGQILFEDGQPVLLRDAEGAPIEIPPDEAPDQPSAVVELRSVVPIRRGPQYRVRSLLDFFLLPGHAVDRHDLYGYAKRFWLRWGQLRERQTLGLYTHVDALTQGDERGASADGHPRAERQDLPAAPHPDAEEKELYEILLLRDLDGDGLEEWYTITLAARDRVILRLQYDDFARSRYLLFRPLPCPYSVYGYSFLGSKLETLIDEHSAIRNMIADRSALATNAPLKRLDTSPWDPKQHPWRPGVVITVRDPRDVEALTVPDVPSSLIVRERQVLAAAERVSGLNDTTLGATPEATRTLGEVQLVTQFSLNRIDEMVRHLQETLEELFDLRHEIWRRWLREHGPQPLPSTLVGLEQRLLDRVEVTAEDLAGVFRGKPRGSTETADPGRLRRDFLLFLQQLAQLSQVSPGLVQWVQHPRTIKAIMRQAMRLYHWADRDLLDLLETQAQQAPPTPPPAGPPSPMSGPRPLTGALAPQPPQPQPGADEGQ